MDDPNFLPYEILERILVERALTHKDIIRFSLTCHRCREASLSKAVWRSKFQQRWPRMLQYYNRDVVVDWKSEYQARHQNCLHLERFIDTMSEKFFLKDEISREAFADLNTIFGHQNFGIDFLIGELYSYVESEEKNLTQKYYASKVMRYLQHIRLKREWAEFLSLPLDQQLLETGAVLLAQWFQPCVCVSHGEVSYQLDVIADYVRKELWTVQPSHPAVLTLQVPSVQLQSSLWPLAQCRPVLNALNKVLYDLLGFQGNEDDYYDPNNSYINQVITRRKGIPVSLAVLYISVARRLGVVCEPVNFPSHFLIRFRHGEERYTYIDVFNNGKFMTEQECEEMLAMPLGSFISREIYQKIPNKLVFERMLRNMLNIGGQRHQMGDSLLMYRTAAELFVVVTPDEIDTRVMLARLYLHLGINLPDVISDLQELASGNPQANADVQNLITVFTLKAERLMAENNSLGPEPILPKLRSENPGVLYSVGLIMKHRRFHYTCVIYGWDKTCEATDEWIQRMHVHLLPKKQYQPFYNVLVEDGSCRYAAQESLRLADELHTIDHPEVGKYFIEYRGNHYMPNNEKRIQYPQDLPVTLDFCRRKYEMGSADVDDEPTE